MAIFACACPMLHCPGTYRPYRPRKPPRSCGPAGSLSLDPLPARSDYLNVKARSSLDCMPHPTRSTPSHAGWAGDRSSFSRATNTRPTAPASTPLTMAEADRPWPIDGLISPYHRWGLGTGTPQRHQVQSASDGGARSAITSLAPSGSNSAGRVSASQARPWALPPPPRPPPDPAFRAPWSGGR